MKAQYLFMSLLTITAVLFTTCKDIDYRDKWVGSYECEKIRHEVQVVILDVTIKGDSTLYLIERELNEYSHGVKCDVKVNSDGYFKKIYDSIGSGSPYIEGNFCKDSLFIYYIYPAQGSTVKINYKGKKIK
jgi:hypothetical protein